MKLVLRGPPMRNWQRNIAARACNISTRSIFIGVLHILLFPHYQGQTVTCKAQLVPLASSAVAGP